MLPGSVCSQRPESHFVFLAKRMRNVGLFCAHLLGLCLILSDPQTEGCGDSGLPPKPDLSAFRENQSLGVSWPRNHDASERDVYEIQISRTKKRTIVYDTNVSIPAVDSTRYTWTWRSDLPLECVDHSVRMRSICDQTAPSPWSNWITNYGTKATDAPKIFPMERMLKEGSSEMFCCVSPEGVNITSITFRNIPYPLLNIGDGVKAILVSNLEIPASFIKILLLTCTDSTGKIRYAGNFISFPPQKPRNLSCATSDMTKITCSWDPGRKRDRNKRNKQTQKLYIENTDHAPIDCEPTSCTFPAVPLQQEYTIRVEVKHLLGEERATYSFNISDRVSPVLEKVRGIPGVTDVSLSWTVLGNLTRNKLLCQVSTAAETIRELTFSSENGLFNVRLEGLHPNTNYSAKVRCSVNGRFWGKWTQSEPFTTYPLVTVDLWRRIQYRLDSDVRHVTLLWKTHVVGRATTVEIKGYTVKWSQGGQTVTEQKDSRQNQADISIGPKKCNFTVQAVLNTGSSVPAHITIPLEDDPAMPPLKKRLSGTLAGGFRLWWDEQASVTRGYTVEWCTVGSTESCTLQWIKVPEGNNTLLLPAGKLFCSFYVFLFLQTWMFINFSVLLFTGHFKPGFRYSFYIYGCTEQGDKLLEIQTGYTQELSSVQYPSIIEPVVSTHASVMLEWHYDEDDPAQPAFITGYLVTVQEAASNKLVFNVSVGDPRQKSVTIKGLQEDQEYVCSVSALTRVGPGLSASITIRTKHNYFSLLAKILTPILLLLSCAVLMWPQRKMLKNGLREIFVYPAGMNIKPPEFENFLYETDRKLQSQKVEECISCDVEVLNIKPLWHESSTLRDPECADPMCSPGSLPSSSVPIQTGYWPQSAVLLFERATNQEMVAISNKSYLSPIAEPQQVEFSQIRSGFETSDSLQGSCAAVYGYISDS
ncbi:leukemia inhibitory factor receptor [Fundulus diaphanus]